MSIYEQNLGLFADCPPASAAKTARLATGRGWLARGLDAIALWHERNRSRRNLLAMSDFMLRDIGIDRSLADREASKPFWRG